MTKLLEEVQTIYQIHMGFLQPVSGHRNSSVHPLEAYQRFAGFLELRADRHLPAQGFVMQATKSANFETGTSMSCHVDFSTYSLIFSV